MNILHIARITEDKTSGVTVVVPQHVIAQSHICNVCLLDINHKYKEEKGLEYKGSEGFPDYLPEPFNKPDLVVFHEVNNFENIRLYKKLLNKKIKYIIVPHGELTSTSQSRKWLKKKIAYALFFNKFIKKANAIQFLSNEEKQKSLFNKKGFISPNGINVSDKFSMSNQDKTIVTYIGRIDLYIKGLDTLLKAIAKIKSFCIDNAIIFNIYGKRYNKQSFIENNNVVENLIKEYSLEKIVFCHDAVFGDEKKNVLLNSDIFIQTSRTEGMPTGILEALAYGLPCIVTKETNLGEEIEENQAGICVYNAHEINDNLVKALLKIMDLKKNFSQIQANAIKLAKKYSWNEVATLAINKYKEIVETK